RLSVQLKCSQKLMLTELEEETAEPGAEPEVNPQTQPEAQPDSEADAQIQLTILSGHTGSVRTCCFIRKDTCGLSASWDGTARLWDVGTGKELRCLTGHAGARLSCARGDPDGGRAVSAGWDKALSVWDLETGARLWRGELGGIVSDARFSGGDGGGQLVTASDLDYNMQVWDTRTCSVVQLIRGVHRSTLTSCRFMLGDRRILSTSLDFTCKVFDLRAMGVTLAFADHKNAVSSASLSADERCLATCSWDKRILMYDISTGMYRSQGPKIFEESHEGSISSCCLSADGAKLVSGSYDNSVMVWDAENGIREIRLQGHDDWVEDVSLSADGAWMMSASKDATLRLWNMERMDEMPAVAESRAQHGVHMKACDTCGKTFSLAGNLGATQCVFCRIIDRSRQETDIAKTIGLDLRIY
ncbi:hypothetical protein BOX15_Mlig021002g1, partial [Macrostomum lignano]